MFYVLVFFVLMFYVLIFSVIMMMMSSFPAQIFIWKDQKLKIIWSILIIVVLKNLVLYKLDWKTGGYHLCACVCVCVCVCVCLWLFLLKIARAVILFIVSVYTVKPVAFEKAVKHRTLEHRILEYKTLKHKTLKHRT